MQYFFIFILIVCLTATHFILIVHFNLLVLTQIYKSEMGWQSANKNFLKII